MQKTTLALAAGLATLACVAILPSRAEACEDVGACWAPPVLEPALSVSGDVDCLDARVERRGTHEHEIDLRLTNDCDAAVESAEPLFFQEYKCDPEDRSSTLEAGATAKLALVGHRSCSSIEPGEPGDHTDTYELDVGETTAQIEYQYRVPTDEEAETWEDENCPEWPDCNLGGPDAGDATSGAPRDREDDAGGGDEPDAATADTSTDAEVDGSSCATRGDAPPTAPFALLLAVAAGLGLRRARSSDETG